jgi:hypothetical protein
MIKIKKLILPVVTFGLIFTSLGITQASAASYSQTGKISFFYGEGKRGSDEKILGANDCAVGKDYGKVIPKGTAIKAQNLSNGKSATVYKWSYGNFGGDVILDVMPGVFKNKLGGNTLDGYIKKGKTSYSY